MKTELTDNQLNFLLSDIVGGEGVRVDMKTAKKWLMENKSLICGGNVYYLRIENLGLGVCRVTKAPLKVRSTLMVKTA
jgi:hypothetical protein